MIEQQPNVENTSLFEQLLGLSNELRQKLESRFDLHPEPCADELQQFNSSDGNVKGSLAAFSGPEIDWLVHSWLGNPQQSNFGTMRLTTWLKPHVRVPHLAFNFSTRVGNIFFYMDYIPRGDLLIDLKSLDRYYEPVNQTYLTLQADPRLSLFTSKSLYIRQFQSPISLCYTCQVTEETIELIRTLACEMMERWLMWVNEAELVPENERAALADRDLLVRRSSAELDPDNQIGVRLFGEELTNKLVRALWGGDRAHP